VLDTFIFLFFTKALPRSSRKHKDKPVKQSRPKDIIVNRNRLHISYQ